MEKEKKRERERVEGTGTLSGANWAFQFMLYQLAGSRGLKPDRLAKASKIFLQLAATSHFPFFFISSSVPFQSEP